MRLKDSNWESKNKFDILTLIIKYNINYKNNDANKLYIHPFFNIKINVIKIT